MKVPLLLVLCLFFLALCTGCGGEGAVPMVRVTGASTIYPIVRTAGEMLVKDAGLRVDAQTGGSTRGFEDTVAGRTDLGAMARELTQQEEAAVVKFPIAYDGVGIAVHADNGIEGLTTAGLIAVYQGKITNWRELGGPDRDITKVHKAEGHATLEVFLGHTGLTRADVRADVVAGDNAQVIRAVSNTKGAIGYVSMGEVIHAAEIGIPVRLIPLDGVAPTLDAVASGDFPMVRTLYLVSKADPVGPSRQLLDFLYSDQGRAVIAGCKYVPLP